MDREDIARYNFQSNCIIIEMTLGIHHSGNGQPSRLGLLLQNLLYCKIVSNSVPRSLEQQQ